MRSEWIAMEIICTVPLTDIYVKLNDLVVLLPHTLTSQKRSSQEFILQLQPTTIQSKQNV